MPKISKVRIVNFNYNDSNRLIADELFDFSNQKENDALNVLINLTNGGGKSVLVQLMMQPMLPKAKVAGRKMESFFNKLSDHCFIALEWFKDNSSEKLLTGIAIAAREIASAEDESSGGMGIKYYTFLANYSDDSCPNSLVNLPLSGKENGNFVPAEYDCIKRFSKKNKNPVLCYASDDHSQWQKKLAEYGIVQDEWRMIEKLNCEEGGLSKFFGEFKTSDQLIDRLLIPTIESKLRSMHSKEDSSLTTMLISYAEQYAGHKNKLKAKGSYEKFLQSLEVLKPLTEDLWNVCSTREQAVAVLFGIAHALQQKTESLQQEQATIQKAIEKIHTDINHIHWEQLSEKYYQCQQAFEQAEQACQNIADQKQRLQKKLEQTHWKLLAQECANYYTQLCKCESSILELQNEISLQEKSSDSSYEIAVLGYSAFCAIQETIEQTQPKLDDCRKQNDTLKVQIKRQLMQVQDTQNAFNQAQSAYDHLKGSLEAAETETDKEIISLDAGISRRLDGLYAEEELHSFKKTVQDQENKLLTAQQKAEAEIQKVEDRLEQIPQVLADFQAKIREHQHQQDQLQKDLEHYETQENHIRSICTEHNLNFDMRFSGEIVEYLSVEKQKQEAKYAEHLRRLALSEEGINAAKSGYLHVPKRVIEYLNSTGVVYTTCEKYLLDLVKSQKISREDCLQILKKYPAAAYGILIDQENNKKFFAYGRETWLPAMIPLFHYKQMDTILHNEKYHSGAIAFYSEEYFADREHYIIHLQEQRQRLLNQRTLEENRIKHLQEQILIVSAFSYTEDWKEQQKKKITSILDQIQKETRKYKEIEAEKQQLRQKKQQLGIQSEGYQAEIQAAQTVLSYLVRVEDRIKTELELTEKVTSQKSKRNHLQFQLTEETQVLDALYHKQNTVQTQLEELEECTATLHTALPEVNGKKADKRISGSWQELLERYRQRVRNENGALSRLQLQLKDKQEQRSQYKNELQKRDIPEAAYYTLLYSAHQEMQLRNRYKELESQMKSLQEEEKNAYGKQCSKESLLQNALQSVSRYEKPLERSQIGSNFEQRLHAYQIQQEQQQMKEKQRAVQERSIEKEQSKLENYLSDRILPEKVPAIALEENYVQQCSIAVSQHKQISKRLESIEHQLIEQLELLHRSFQTEFPEIQSAIDSMQQLLQNTMQGDRYFTLDSLVDVYRKNTGLAISQISTDLKEFENFRRDLVYQCTLQGKQIFEGLKQMESSSRVSVSDSRSKKCMIQFGLPDHIDIAIAEISIGDEIDKGTKELVEKLADGTSTESEIKKYAEKIVGSRSLLRKYLGRDLIEVSAYKIDQNPENSGYRRWKETQINNSGAEKFVVYFAVILSLINYTRGSLGGIQDKALHSVLILDNPFGATSSKHILLPMFAIAKHFRVQMICLSDINKTDIINCFDIVIKALVKKRPMSHYELLTHEGNELIDHGYYRSEQISLI